MPKCQLCNTTAVFNLPQETKGKCCIKHKSDDMIDVVNRKCKQPDCDKQPTFNIATEKIALFCDKHKTPGMINLKYKPCLAYGCDKFPTYGLQTDKKPSFCLEHKSEHMVDIYNRKCLSDKCDKQPMFANRGDKRGLYCALHKPIDMIDVVNRKCKEQGCDKQPSFGLLSTRELNYCSAHKKSDMVDLVHKLCLFDGCPKRASFNFMNEPTVKFCREHKEIGMIHKEKSKCNHKGCLHNPKYRLDRKLFCEQHKSETMTLIQRKNLCKHDSCQKQATFGMKGEKGMYCFDHKIDSMVDVKHKTCSIEICTTRPSYGYPGSSPSFCSSHHPEGTISKSLKKCIFNEDGDCKEYATHGPDRKTLLRCEEHALPEDISLVERKCVQCSRIDVLNKNNICVNFCSLEEADRVFKKLIKHKEESIGRLLTSEINHNLYSSDKIIDTSCTKRRPDFVYHFGTHVLIVEVDENQHNGYLCTAYGDGKEGKLKGESIRMYQIGQCFDGLPILFLRYNPDTYKSPHKVNQKERQQTLVRWVKYCMEYKEWMLGFKVKYLFYDSYEPSDTEWKDVEPVL